MREALRLGTGYPLVGNPMPFAQPEPIRAAQTGTMPADTLHMPISSGIGSDPRYSSLRCLLTEK
jgi:hypothetical protein